MPENCDGELAAARVLGAKQGFVLDGVDRAFLVEGLEDLGFLVARPHRAGPFDVVAGHSRAVGALAPRHALAQLDVRRFRAQVLDMLVQLEEFLGDARVCLGHGAQKAPDFLERLVHLGEALGELRHALGEARNGSFGTNPAELGSEKLGPEMRTDVGEVDTDIDNATDTDEDKDNDNQDNDKDDEKEG